MQHRFIKLDASGAAIPVDSKDHAAVSEPARRLIWTAADAIDEDVTFAEAETAVAALNTSRFCGFDDWRLPTVEELFGLADRTRYSPDIDTDFFPTCASDWYWASTEYKPSPADYAWIVGFYYGIANYDSRSNLNRVRAVRASSRQ